MPRDPSQDYASSGHHIEVADIAGVLRQSLPVIKTEDWLSHTIPLMLTFPPVNYRQFRLELRAPAGVRIWSSTINSVYVRYPNQHDFFAQSWNLSPCPLDPDLAQIWLGGDLVFLPRSDQSGTCVLSRPAQNNIVYRHPVGSLSDPWSVRSTSNWTGERGWSLGVRTGSFLRPRSVLSGEAQIGAVQINIEIMVDDPREVNGRGIPIEFFLGGQPIGKKIMMVIGENERFPDYGNIAETMPASHADVALFNAEFAWNEILFACHGPGLPTNLEIQYRSANSAVWKGTAPSPDWRKILPQPFGHGWSSLYGLRIITIEEERSSRPTDIPPTLTKTHYLQDSNGRLILFTQSGSTNRYTSNNRLLSPTFNVIYEELIIEKLPAGGFKLWAGGSRLWAEFDDPGRLIKLARTDHGRPTTLKYSGAGLKITDSQGRDTQLIFNQNDLVQQIIDPGGRTWRFSYTDHTLDAIEHSASGTRYQFQYDADHFQLVNLRGPAIDTQISYRGTGAANRWGSHSVERVTEGNFWAEFTWQGAMGQEEFDAYVQFPNGRAVHYEGIVTSGYWDWYVRKGANVNEHVAMGYSRSVTAMPEPFDPNRQLIRPYRISYSSAAGTERPRTAAIYHRAGIYTRFEYEDKAHAKDIVNKIIEPAPEAGGPNPTHLFKHNDYGEVIEQEDPIGIVMEIYRSNRPKRRGLVERTVDDPLNSASEIRYTYDDIGNVTTETNEEGETSIFEYDALDRLEREEHADGSWRRYRYHSDSNLLAGIETPAGIILELEYTYDGLIRRERDPEVGVVEYVYNELRELVTEIHDRQTVSYIYDQAGRLKETREQAGPDRVITISQYNPWGSVTEVSEQINNNPTQITNFIYDDEGRVEQIIAPQVTEGGTTWRPTITNEYTPRYQLIGGIHAYPGLKKVTQEVRPGIIQIIEYEYDFVGQMVGLKKGFPPNEYAHEQFVYDLAGNLIRHMGDDFNRILTPTRPRRRRRRTEREARLDSTGNLEAVVDPNNANNDLVSVTRDKTGRIKALFLPDAGGNMAAVERRQYLNGVLARVLDQYGNATNIDYDPSGRPAVLIDPLGTRINLDYDTADRVTKLAVAGFDGTRAETRYTYYANNGELEEVAQLRNGQFDRTRYSYNAMGLLETETNPLGFTVDYQYTPDGNLIRRTDGMHRTTSYEYDPIGRLVKTIYPGNWIVNSSYDSEGRLLDLEDPAFKKVITRNVLGQPETIAYTNKAANVTRTMRYRYDDFGALAEIEDDTAAITSFERDDNNNVHSIKYGSAASPITVATFTRDRQGRIKTRESGGYTFNYDRDAGGRFNGIEVARGTQAVARIEYGHDQLNRIVRARYHHLNLDFYYRFDGLGRLGEELIRTSSGTPLWRELNQYDEAGNVIQRTVSGVVSRMQYNGLNQLLSTNTAGLSQISVASISVSADSQIDNAHDPDLAIDGIAPTGSGPGDAFVSEPTQLDHWLELQLSQAQVVSAIELSLPHDHGLPSQLKLSYQEPGTQAWKAFAIIFIQGGREVSAFTRSTGFPVVRPVLGPAVTGPILALPAPAFPSLPAHVHTMGPGLTISPLPPGAIPAFSFPRADATAIVPGQFTIRLIFNPVQTDAIRLTQPRGAGPTHPAISAHANALAINEIRLFYGVTNSSIYQYDPNGNLIDDGRRTFAYDAEHRLVAIFEPGQSDLSFVYGPDGSLLQRVDRLRNTRDEYQYAGGERYAVFDDTGSKIETQLIGDEPDQNLGVNKGSSVYYFNTDAIGSVHQVLSSTSIDETRVTNAWGHMLDQLVGQQPGAISPITDFGFAGRPSYDDDLLNMRTRSYSVASQRFNSPDVGGMQEFPNRYLYVQNDPVNLVDRDGQIFTHILGGIASVAVGYVVSKVAGQDYELSDAAIDFGVGFASSGLSSLAKCAKLGNTIYRMSQGGRLARTAARAAPLAGSTALGVGGDYVTARLKGEEFDLASSLVMNSLGSFAGSFFTRPYCFIAGTYIETPEGHRLIESLTKGDKISCRAETSSDVVAGEVVEIREAEAYVLVEVGVSYRSEADRSIDDTIRCTPEHPWWVEKKGWVEASGLAAGDRLLCSDNTCARVGFVEMLPAQAKVYSLEIDSTHNYFVSSSPDLPGLLVHNACSKDDVLAAARPHFDHLNRWRRKFKNKFSGPGRGRHTFAVAMSEGSRKRFWSRNGWVATFRRHGRRNTLNKKFGRFGRHKGLNVGARTHAEAGALNQIANRFLAQTGGVGRRSVIVVDKAVCAWCSHSAGISKMARRMGLDELVIIWREGGKSGVLAWERNLPKQLKKVDTLGDWVMKLLNSTKHEQAWMSKPLNRP